MNTHQMHKTDVTLERIRSFVRIAERQNLSAVAREFKVGQSTITRHLRELEEALGVPLITRTTRQVTLTTEGQQYYIRCVQILNLVEQADQEIQSKGKSISGTIKVSCSSALGILYISRMIFEFQDRYPDIRIDFDLTDAQVDLVREGVDIALRFGPLADSSMKLRVLGKSQRVLVASPNFIKNCGHLVSPQDLERLDGISLSKIGGGDSIALRDERKQIYSIPLNGRLNVDHGLAAREALLFGRGFGMVHRWLVDDYLVDGRLVVLFPEYNLSSVPLNMTIVPERSNIERVRLLVEHLSKDILSIPGISQ